MKKLLLLIVIVFSIACYFEVHSVAAQNNSTIDPSVLIEGGPDYLSKEYQEQIETVNKLVEAYIKEKGLLDLTPKSSGGKQLSVPLYKQANGYYCGPACGRMVLRFVTGQLYSQAHLANYDNMQTDYHGHTWMYRLTHTLNSKIGSSVYQHVGTWNANFGNDLIYSIDRNKPMGPQVRGRKLPNYPNNHLGGGHYIVAIGYQYGFSGGSGYSNVTYHDPHDNNNHFGTYTCPVTTMVSAINDHFGWHARATR